MAKQASIVTLNLAEASQRLRNGKSVERHWNIYKSIRERISLLHYVPGTVLSEVELAAEFQVSRTPIRRVLQRLQYEGLVEIRNGVGTIVSDIDIKTLKEIYDLRMHLAELMGVLSPNLVTDAQVETMKQLLQRAELLNDSPDHERYERYGRLCNDLEELLLSMIGSAPLREITDLFYYRVSRIWFTFLPSLDWNDIVSAQKGEITGMLEAMKRGDMRGVGQIRRIHMHGILTRVSAYISGEAASVPTEQFGD